MYIKIHSLGCKMCNDECSEAHERDDQSNIRETLQDCNILRREGSTCEILCIRIKISVAACTTTCLNSFTHLTHQQETKMSRL